MDAVVGLLAIGLPLLVLAAYAALSRRAIRRGVGHSFLTPFQDMWDPAAGRAEIVFQAEAATPAPGPGDPPVLRQRLRSR